MEFFGVIIFIVGLYLLRYELLLLLLLGYAAVFLTFGIACGYYSPLNFSEIEQAFLYRLPLFPEAPITVGQFFEAGAEVLLIPPSLTGMEAARQSAVTTLSLISGSGLAILGVLLYISGKISSALSSIKGAVTGVDSAMGKLRRD